MYQQIPPLQPEFGFSFLFHLFSGQESHKKRRIFLCKSLPHKINKQNNKIQNTKSQLKFTPAETTKMSRYFLCLYLMIISQF